MYITPGIVLVFVFFIYRTRNSGGRRRRRGRRKTTKKITRGLRREKKSRDKKNLFHTSEPAITNVQLSGRKSFFKKKIVWTEKFCKLTRGGEKSRKRKIISPGRRRTLIYQLRIPPTCDGRGLTLG
jgi:hypothetical protein